MTSYLRAFIYLEALYHSWLNETGRPEDRIIFRNTFLQCCHEEFHDAMDVVKSMGILFIEGK